MSVHFLFAIRETELWTPMSIAVSSVLLLVVVAALLWGVSVGTSQYDREP
jgi:nitrogen fixation-related uncharacterized protein